MFSFLDHIHDIWTVALARGVDVGIAFEMFRTDVKVGNDENTMMALPEVDFGKLKEQWDAMTDDDQSNALTEYDKFIKANYMNICKAFPDGKTAVGLIVRDWRAVHGISHTQI